MACGNGNCGGNCKRGYPEDLPTQSYWPTTAPLPSHEEELASVEKASDAAVAAAEQAYLEKLAEMEKLFETFSAHAGYFESR